METRNPNEEEITAYEQLHRKHELLRLDLKEAETDLQEKYMITGDVGLTPDGIFVNKEGHRLRKPVKGGKNIPAHLLHKATREDVVAMTAARIALQKQDLVLERFIAALRVACDAPHFAKLSTEYKWVTPDNPPMPIVIEEDEKEEAGAGNGCAEHVDEFSVPEEETDEQEDATVS